MGYDRDVRAQGVGQLHSIGETPEQGFWCASTGGGGGEKGAGRGERGEANQEPDAVPGSPVTCAWPRTAGTSGCLRVMTRGRSPVRESRTPGSVRGASGHWRPYRDPSGVKEYT
jgi:hypothetical protein